LDAIRSTGADSLGVWLSDDSPELGAEVEAIVDVEDWVDDSDRSGKIYQKC
jgi:hypothetical protein